MTGQLQSIVFDVPDVAGLTEFYRALTGWAVTEQDDGWADLTLPDGHRVSLQAAPDHLRPAWPDPDHPQQLHLDMLVPEIETAADRAVSLGATRLAAADTGSSAWITLADPAGHPFDLCRREGVGDGVSAPMGLYGVCIDTDDPAALSRFYAALLGRKVSWEGAEGALVEGTGPAVFLQTVARHVRPQWPDPAHPQQGHLDVHVSGIEAAEAEILSAGAVKLDRGGQTYRVYLDPSGHPFCLVFNA